MSLDDPVEAEPVGGTNGAAAKFVPAGARGRRGARLPVLKGVADSKDLAMKGVDALGVGGAEVGGARRPGQRGRGGARRNQVASLPPCLSFLTGCSVLSHDPVPDSKVARRNPDCTNSVNFRSLI